MNNKIHVVATALLMLVGMPAVSAENPRRNAAWNDAIFRAVTDHTNALYKCGEEIVFTLNLEGVKEMPEGKYAVLLKSQGDDGRSVPDRLVPFELGKPIVIKDKINVPGFIRYEAVMCDTEGQCVFKDIKSPWGPPQVRGCFGAGAEPEKLTHHEEPKDFDEFWTGQKKALAAVPMKAEMKKVSESEVAEVFAVSIPCVGNPSTGYIAIPKAAKDGKKFPIDLSFHGYGRFKQGPMKGEMADKIEASFNAHGYELDREPEYYEAFWKNVTLNERGFYGLDEKENENPETSYFLGMALRLIRAVEWVKTLDAYDGKNLRVWGGSQGGMQSIWAAAFVPGIKEIEAIVPWGTDWYGKGHGRYAFPPLTPKYAPGLDYFDTINFAKRIPVTCTVDISRVGLGDYHCPPSGEFLLYNAIKAPKRMRMVQNSDHGGAPKGVNQEVVYESGAAKTSASEGTGINVLGDSWGK